VTRRLVAIAVITCLAAVGCGAHVVADRVRSAGGSASPSASAAPAGMQRAWLRGVGIDAPAQWLRDDVHCGTPMADTLIVEFTGEGTEACLISRPPAALSVISIGTSRPDNAVYDETTIDDVPAREATRQTDDGRTERLIYFPDRDVYVSIASPDESVVQAAERSVQVTDTDPETGCVVHTHEYDDGAPTGQASSFAILPGDPTSAAACVYVNGWLEETAVVTGDKLTTLMNAIRAAPATTDQRAPDDTGCQSVADLVTPADNPPMLLRFDGPDGKWRLVAKINPCTRWQSTISSGSVTRRIDQQLLLALPPVWTSYPDPDSMDIP